MAAVQSYLLVVARKTMAAVVSQAGKGGSATMFDFAIRTKYNLVLCRKFHDNGLVPAVLIHGRWEESVHTATSNDVNNPKPVHRMVRLLAADLGSATGWGRNR